MTIYKWWPSREALLIDAFLHHAAQMLPLPPASSGSPAARARRHAAAYAEALQGEFGKVQLAVVSECISKTGSAELFYARYLQFRRDALVEMIAAGQSDGSILAEHRPRISTTPSMAACSTATSSASRRSRRPTREPWSTSCCDRRASPNHRAGRTGAESLSVRSRSVMSTTVSIGAVSS